MSMSLGYARTVSSPQTSPWSEADAPNDDAPRPQRPGPEEMVAGPELDYPFVGPFGGRPAAAADRDVDETVAEIWRAANLPPIDAAEQRQAEALLRGDPRLLEAMKAELLALSKQPEGKTALWQAAQTWSQQTHVNIWPLLLVALREALADQNNQLRYNLDRLQMYTNMATQMSDYMAILQGAQQALDNAMAAEKDLKKRAFIEVPMGDQRSYGPECLYTLAADGTMAFVQQAKTPSAAPQAAALQPQDNAKGAWWRLGYGPVRQSYTTADGKVWRGQGKDDAARRLDAIAQITAHGQQEANAGNMVTPQGLGLRLQMYAQQREQLQKFMDKWQNRFHADTEAKNQTTSAITTVLKNLYDMQTSIVRQIQ